MFLLLLLLFVGVPFIEVTLLLEISDTIGGWNTIGIVLITGLLGAHYAKQEGHRVWVKLRKDLEFGVLPADSLVNALLIFIGGFLLITPGFITDFLGLSFVFAPTRRLLVKYAKLSIEKAIRSGKLKVQTYGKKGFEGNFTPGPPPPERPVYEAQVIDLVQKKQERQADKPL